MNGIMKKTTAAVLAFGMMISMFSGMTLHAFAETEITNIALTGDITPAEGQAMTFAKVPSNTDYTVIQAWYNVDNGKGFTDSEEYNNMFDDEYLMPEAERKFEEGKTYSFSVLIIPQSADVKFTPDMTVSVEPYGNMQFLGDLGNGMVAYELDFCVGVGHIHVSSSEYGKNNESHWLKCLVDDGFVFDDTFEPHDIDAATGVCEVCGYIATEEDATKLVSQPNTSIVVDCGGAIELAVEATGRNLKYSWELGESSSRVSFIDDENFRGYGLKVSGSDTATLKIENCNQMLEKKLPIVCRVTGMWGEVETEEINVEVIHRSEVYVSVDENGHKVQCGCGKLIQSAEAHEYNSEKVCEKCGYEKGSVRTKFREATLELPDFSDKVTASRAKASATLSGVGIKENTTGIKEILFGNYDDVVGDNEMLQQDKGYWVRIYPDLEDNFYMGEGTFLTYITYNGNVRNCYTYVDEDGKCYLNIPLGKPYVRKVARFFSNGGSGAKAVFMPMNTAVSIFRRIVSINRVTNFMRGSITESCMPRTRTNMNPFILKKNMLTLMRYGKAS